MIKNSKLFVSICLVGAMISCGKKEKSTASGMKYTVIKEGTAPIEDGQFMVMSMSYKDDKDSVWMTTEDKDFPIVVPKTDSAWSANTGSIEQIFNELKVGDSVTFSVSVNDFFKNSVHSPAPPAVDTTGNLTFYVGVNKALNKEEMQDFQQEMMEKQRKKMEDEAAVQLKEDVKTIEDYLAANNIKAEKTESGLFYVINEAGGSDVSAAAGDTVKVNYTGKVLEGAYFDTSDKAVAQEQGLYDERREPYEPLSFVLGQGRVIKGWDEGIALLKKGDKATLYIPSTLAYGPRAVSEEITANSILVFTVDLVDVQSATAAE